MFRVSSTKKINWGKQWKTNRPGHHSPYWLPHLFIFNDALNKRKPNSLRYLLLLFPPPLSLQKRRNTDFSEFLGVMTTLHWGKLTRVWSKSANLEPSCSPCIQSRGGGRGTEARAKGTGLHLGGRGEVHVLVALLAVVEGVIGRIFGQHHRHGFSFPGFLYFGFLHCFCAEGGKKPFHNIHEAPWPGKKSRTTPKSFSKNL